MSHVHDDHTSDHTEPSVQPRLRSAKESQTLPTPPERNTRPRPTALRLWLWMPCRPQLLFAMRRRVFISTRSTPIVFVLGGTACHTQRRRDSGSTIPRGPSCASRPSIYLLPYRSSNSNSNSNNNNNNHKNNHKNNNDDASKLGGTCPLSRRAHVPGSWWRGLGVLQVVSTPTKKLRCCLLVRTRTTSLD